MGADKRRKLRERSKIQTATETRPQPAKAPGDRALARVVAVALVLLTLAVYWHVLGNAFIDMDDDEYVTSNIHVMQGITPSAVAWAFTTVHSSNWHPVTWMSHMLDCQLYGTKPMGHHLTSLLLHILNTLLLFLLLRRMMGSLWRSAFVAALFAIHPLHVESVAWVAERKDVLSTMFWLLTMLAYCWYTRKPQAKRYVPVAVLFALGLMAKPMLVSLPLVLLLMDYWPLGRAKSYNARRLIVEKLPLFALAAASCVCTFLAQTKGGAVGTLEQFSLPLRVENALVSYVAYLGKMLWPRGLAALYPFPPSVPASAALGAAIALGVITVAAVRLRTTRPWLAMGWLWYLVTLIPVIGIVQVGNQAMADRYTYVPLIGVFIAIVWSVPGLSSVAWRRASAALACAMILALAVVTHAQVGYWRNSITLFEHTVACTDRNYIAHGNLAAALALAGKADAAISEARLTASMAPPHAARPHEKLGSMLAQNGNTREGIAECREALEIDPDLYDAHYSLGVMLDSQGDTDGAMREYEKAIRLKPDSAESADTHNNLGLLLGKQNRLDEAIRHFQASIRLNPLLYTSHANYGNALLARGSFDKAAAQYQEALRLNHDCADARRGLELAQARQRPSDDSTAHNNRGLLLGKQGHLDEAIAEFREALRLNPRSADTECNMAVALSMSGKTDEAIAHLRKAVQINPEQPTAHGNLAVLYYQVNDYVGAWREVKLCRKYGGSPGEGFLNSLAAKMPEPPH